jgi:hypothetical protein
MAKAAKKLKISEAVYIETALEDRFHKDGLLPPENKAASPALSEGSESPDAH